MLLVRYSLVNDLALSQHLLKKSQPVINFISHLKT
jgi:hypothetical protein